MDSTCVYRFSYVNRYNYATIIFWGISCLIWIICNNRNIWIYYRKTHFITNVNIIFSIVWTNNPLEGLSICQVYVCKGKILCDSDICNYKGYPIIGRIINPDYMDSACVYWFCYVHWYSYTTIIFRNTCCLTWCFHNIWYITINNSKGFYCCLAIIACSVIKPEIPTK